MKTTDKTDSSRLSQFNGQYLISNPDIYGGDIFLLLNIEGELTGIRVNKYYKNDDGTNMHGSDLPNEFELGNFTLSLKNFPNHPILHGGSNLDRGMFVLYTLPIRERTTETITQCMYQTKPISEFLKYIETSGEIFFCQLVYGAEDFTLSKLESRVILNGWEIRSGFHALAYGTLLENKTDFVDFLPKETDTNILSGDLDIGSMFNSFRDVIHEAHPSMVRASIFSYLKSTQPDLDGASIEKATRLMMAVVDSNLGDIQDVMRSYTHGDWFEKHEELLQDKKAIDFFYKYDERIDMHNRIGLNSILYDISVATIFQKLPSIEEAEKLKAKRKTGGIEDKIDMLTEIVKKQ